MLERTKFTSEMREKIEAMMSLHNVGGLFNQCDENNAIPNTNCHPERSEAKPSAVEGPAVSLGDLSSAVGQPLAQLLRRPEIIIENLLPILRLLAPDFFDL